MYTANMAYILLQYPNRKLQTWLESSGNKSILCDPGDDDATVVNSLLNKEHKIRIRGFDFRPAPNNMMTSKVYFVHRDQ